MNHSYIDNLSKAMQEFIDRHISNEKRGAK